MQLTRDKCLAKAYNRLYNLNQRLKNISSIYYFGDGVIYMKSLVPFVESFLELRYPDHYADFNGGIVLPNALFNFGKNAKKSKMSITEINDKEGHRFLFEEGEFNYTLNISPQHMEDLKKDLKYKRIFDIQDESKYDVFESDYYPLDVSQVDDLCDRQYIEVTLPTGDLIPLTRHLFLDIKKGDYIQIAKVARQTISKEKNEYRLFFLINHDTDLYTKYTLFNKISSGGNRN